MALQRLKNKVREERFTGFPVEIVGTLKKGEKTSTGAVDLGYFLFKPSKGTAAERDALSFAFRKLYGEKPTVITPVYLPHNYWGDVHLQQFVSEQAHYITKNTALWVAEADGVDIIRYRKPTGKGTHRNEVGDDFIQRDPLGFHWHYSFKGGNGEQVNGKTICPWNETIKIVLVLDGLWDAIPEQHRNNNYPKRLAVEFFSKAKWEVDALFSQLEGLKEAFHLGGSYSVPCSATPLSIRRHVKNDHWVENGLRRATTIYPTEITAAADLEEAIAIAQGNARNDYLLAVATGGMQKPQPLLIGAPEIPNLEGDANDILFGDAGGQAIAPIVVDRRPVVQDEPIEGDFSEVRIPSGPALEIPSIFPVSYGLFSNRAGSFSGEPTLERLADYMCNAISIIWKKKAIFAKPETAAEVMVRLLPDDYGVEFKDGSKPAPPALVAHYLEYWWQAQEKGGPLPAKAWWDDFVKPKLGMAEFKIL